MQLSRPLLIYSPFFSPEDCFFREDFLIFCSKRPLFLCLAVFFVVGCSFFVLMMCVVVCLFFLSAFFFRFSLCFFFALGGFISTTQEKGERNK